MNNDLISRDALKKRIKAFKYYEIFSKSYLIDIIDNAPAVSFMISPDYVTELQNRNKELIKQLEEAERPRGEWIDLDTDESWYRFKCSNCLSLFPRGMFMKGYPYCPKCGADMRKESREDVFTRKEELSKEESDWLIDFITKEGGAK